MLGSAPSMDAHRQVLLRDPPRDSDHMGGSAPYTPSCWPRLLESFTAYPKVLFAMVVLLLVLLVFAVVTVAMIAQTMDDCEEAVAIRRGPSALTCGYNGKDLSSIAGANIYYTDGTGNFQTNYELRPCGAVVGSPCGSYFGGTSEVCAFVSENYFNLATYAANAGTWSTWSQGIRYTINNGGQCPTGGAATTTIYYTCDAGYSQPRISSVEQSPKCSYNIYVLTNLAC